MEPIEFERIDSEARTILISLNPKSGGSDRRGLVDQLSSALSRRGFQVEILQDIDRLCEAVTQSLEAGELRTVVSAGGDGTASLLVNRLPADVPITIFPLGTANLLAKFLAASPNVCRTVDIITSGHTVRLDAGLANDRLFLVVASCGFDADVVDRIHSNRKGHIGYWSYAVPIINSIRKYRFPKMKFVADERSLKSARWAFVFNLPQYAMNLKLIDNAKARDGRLDLCTFRDGGFFRGLYYFVAVLFRWHRSISATSFTQFKSLSIEAGSPVPIELDGDPGGYLPVTISVVPKRLRVLVAESWSENRPGL